jgi:hypothetical protein
MYPVALDVRSREVAARIWTLAHLTPEQERLVKEAETELGGSLLLAYKIGDIVASPLDEHQVAYIQDLEEKLGLTILAVQPV